MSVPVQRRIRELLRVARHPDLRRIEAAFAVFAIAEWATWLAITVYAFERGGVAEAGLVAVVLLAPATVVAPFAAFAGDRFRIDRVLALGYVVQSVAMLATAVAMGGDAPAVVVYPLATAVAVAVTFTRPAMGALLPAVTRTPADLTAANVSVGVLQHLGVFAGPAIAGLLLHGSGGPARVYAAMGVGVALAALAASGLRLDRTMVTPQQPIAAGDVIHEALEGFRTLRRESDLRVLVILLGLRMMVLGGCGVLFVAVADDLFTGAAASRSGLFAAGFGLGALLAAFGSVAFVGRAGLSTPHALAVLTTGVSLASIAVVRQPVFVVGLFMLAGAGESVARITGNTLVQRAAPTEVLCRVFGVIEGIDMAAFAFGAVSVSLIVNWVGLSSAMVVIGSTLVLGIALGARRLRKIDDAAPPPRPALVRLVRAQEMFASLPAPSLTRLLTGVVPIEVASGTVVIREGEAGDRYYLVERGDLVVTVNGHRVHTLGPGEAFGEIALVRDVPRTATVTATSAALLQAIERTEFLTALTGHPQGLQAAGDRAQRLLDSNATIQRTAGSEPLPGKDV